jgi:hypothetical protein
MIKRLIVGVVAMLAVATARADETLSADGYGPVRIGMTVPQAETALGSKLVSADGETPNSECYHVRPAKGRKGIVFMVQDRHITRASISTEEGSRIKTDSGIGLGDSEQKVLHAFDKVEVTPHEYGGKDDHYLTSYVGPMGQQVIAATSGAARESPWTQAAG